MKSIFSLSIAVAAMLAGTCAATDSMLDSVPNAQLVGRQDTTYQWEGCFSDPGTMKFNSIGQWQSKQNCHDACVPAGFSVEATTNKSACWCGNQLPPKANLVDNSKCNLNCTGYPQELCGGDNFYSVYLTGIGKVDGSSAAASSSPPSSSSSSSTPTSSSPASVVTVGGQTVVITTGPTSSNVAKSSTNKAAIAAGVVVGLVAFAALAGGGAFLYMRRRKIRQVEEEYRRNAAVSEFVAGGKTHNSNNGSFSDTRLDPTVMAQRRMSDGSIADNQDYSRRILKVTNA